MTDERYNELAQRFPFIVKWEEHMGSYHYYRMAQLERAATDSAPENAIYFQSNMIEHPVGVFRQRGWVTTDDISNPHIIKEWGLVRT